MKPLFTVLSCAVFLAWSRTASCADPASPIKITIDFHVPGGAAGKLPSPIELDDHDPGSYFAVILENTSAKPVLLDDYMINYLYFEITDEHGKVTKVYQPVPAASAIRPPWPLAPGKTYLVNIHYVCVAKVDYWGKYPFPFPPPGEKRQVTIRAVAESMAGKNADVLKDEEKTPVYTPEMLQRTREQNAADLKNDEKKGFWVEGGQSEAYKVTLIGSDRTKSP